MVVICTSIFGEFLSMFGIGRRCRHDRRYSDFVLNSVVKDTAMVCRKRCGGKHGFATVCVVRDAHAKERGGRMQFFEGAEGERSHELAAWH
jgi:hypothetical protein